MTPINDDTAVLPAVPAEDPARDAVHDEEPVAEVGDDDVLAAELAKAAPKRWWNTTTVVLGALVILVGGFVGGLESQKHWGTAAASTSSNRPAGFNGQNRGGYGAPAGGSYQGGGLPGGTRTGTQGSTPTAAAAGTTGTVKLVDGTTIYVQTPDGNVVTVKTDGKTTVSAASKGKISDVKAGEPVTVQGATGTDGTVTATSVTTQKK